MRGFVSFKTVSCAGAATRLLTCADTGRGRVGSLAGAMSDVEGRAVTLTAVLGAGAGATCCVGPLRICGA